MSIGFIFFMTFGFTTPNAIILLVCIGVGCCLCPKNSKVCLAGTALQQLMNNVPTLALAAEESTALIICDIVITAPLFGDVSVLLDMKKCPLALLRALLSDRYNASLDTMHCCGLRVPCCLCCRLQLCLGMLLCSLIVA